MNYLGDVDSRIFCLSIVLKEYVALFCTLLCYRFDIWTCIYLYVGTPSDPNYNSLWLCPKSNLYNFDQVLRKIHCHSSNKCSIKTYSMVNSIKLI